MSQSLYSIRQLTRRLRVTARALRHYESKRLVAPQRKGRNRLYTFEDYARLLIVLRGRRLGYTISEMCEVLRMYDYKDSQSNSEMLMAREKFVKRIANLKSKQRDIDEAVQQLSECVRQIDGALEGHPRTPWYEFFAHNSFRNQSALVQ